MDCNFTCVRLLTSMNGFCWVILCNMYTYFDVTFGYMENIVVNLYCMQRCLRLGNGVAVSVNIQH